MQICFFRHGIAVDKTDPAVTADRDRPLTAEGVTKTHAAAEGLARMEISFDKILTSPWLRALQTARIVAEVHEMGDRVELMEELAGDRSPEDVIRGLGRYASLDRIMLVGHQPLLGACISVLISGGIGIDIDLKKAGACTVEADRVHPNANGTLLWLLTAKQLRLMR
jgi:phosphohistidine phosphatase